MPFLNTYVYLENTPLHIMDCMTIDGNRRKPAQFKTAGDTLDLGRVDMGMFIQSSYRGELHKYFVSGKLTAQPMEVSEERYKVAMDALARQGHSSLPGHMIPTTHKVVQIEPGLSLAVEQTAPAIMKPAPEISVLPEVGSGQMVEAGMGIGTPMDEKKVVTTDALSEAEIELGAGQKWKAGLGFKEQKNFVRVCEDVELLNVIAEQDDSAFRRLATARLKELKDGVKNEG